MEKFADWIKCTRPQFLTLSIVLVFLGTSAAVSEGAFNLKYSLLALLGLVFLHISVNVLNDYSDYHSGIDFITTPTPFSGGSRMLVMSRIAPSEAYVFGVLCVAGGVLIGTYFVWVTNWMLLPLLLVGVFAVWCYTDLLAKQALGELFAGLGLGLLPILGSYFIQTGHYSWTTVAAGIPAGLLTFNLLLLNEFPDFTADSKCGRKNLLIMWGVKRAGRIYAVVMGLVYVSILAGVVSGMLPLYCLIGLLTIPVAVRPIRWAWNETDDLSKIIPALQANVISNLGTQTLLGVGFIASKYA